MGQGQGACGCIHQAADAVDEIEAVVQETNTNGAATTLVSSGKKQISLDGGCEFHSEAPVEDVEELISIIEFVPLFMQLSSEQHTMLASAFTTLKYKEGETLYKRGDEGNEFFIIADGTVSLVEKGETSTLSKGDWVGLSALTRRTVRRATVIAESDVEVLKLMRAAFRSIGMYQQLNIVRRNTIIAHDDIDRDISTRPPSDKSPSDVKVIVDALKADTNLNELYELDDSMVNSLTELAWEEIVEEDCEIITYGSTDADYFYIVKSGEFELMSPSDTLNRSSLRSDNAVEGGTSPTRQRGGNSPLRQFSKGRWSPTRPRSRSAMQSPPRRSATGLSGVSSQASGVSGVSSAQLTQSSGMSVSGEPLSAGFYSSEVLFGGSEGSVFSEESIYSPSFPVNAILQSRGFVVAGGSFGELALHELSNPAATVIARQKSVVWVIDRNIFKRILVRSGDKSVRYAEYLQRNEAFMDLQLAEKMEIAKGLNEARFATGEHITEQNTKGDTFHILIEGEVKFLKDGKEFKRFKATENDVLMFGEQVLLDKDKSLCPETVTVVSETAKTVHMNKAGFELLLAPLAQLQKRGLKGRSTVKDRKTLLKSHSFWSSEGSREGPHILRKDLTVLGRLGCGGFGVVDLVEHNDTKKTYAFKSVSKAFLVIQRQHQLIINEAKIQVMCSSPFIVKLYETFADYNNLLFLLELMLGGTVIRAYIQHELFGSVAHCQFYVASSVYAFAHMHELNIIFRDAKPENMLLGSSGRMKLADFGLAKVSVGKTYTMCGTPHYTAPETCTGKGHAHEVDWWALAVITFELMAGDLPFDTSPTVSAQVFGKIKLGFGRVDFPPSMKGQCEDFVKGIGNLSPTERLPMKKGGIDNIKNHVWFKDFNWKALLDEALEPPYKPVVKNKRDLANFDFDAENLPPVVDFEEYDDGSNWDADFATSA